MPIKPVFTLSVFGALALPQVALAQLELEEVIVTAQKTEQSLQEVPVSLTVVSGAALAERNINELTQLTQAAPTLQVGQDNTFSVRGIGSQISTETTDPSVALAIDGVSFGRNALASVPFNDIEAVEVLNGPQGLLFGKNASAGLINIRTKKPVIGETSGSVGLEYLIRDTTPADAKGTVVRGIFNAPVSENSALRINALYSDQDSIIENIFPNTERTDLDQERWGIKAKYLIENGPLSVYLIADYNENNGTGGQYGRTYRSIGEQLNGDGEPSVLFDLLSEDGIVAGPENLTNNSDGPMFSDLETGGLQGTVRYRLDNDMEVVNITSWRYFERDQQLHNDFSKKIDLVVNTNKTNYDQFSNELSLVWPSNDHFSGQAGLFFYQQESDIEAILEVVGPPPFVAEGFPFCVNAPVVMQGPPPNCNISNDVFLGSDSITDFETTSYAAYGQFDFFLTDDFTLTAGARLTQDEVTTSVVQSQRNYFQAIGGPRATITESTDNTNVSWKLGGQYTVSDAVMTYASIGQGYKAPGFNTDFLGIDEVPFAIDEEVSNTLEFGFKSQLLQDRMILNVSAFYTNFEDYQAQSFNLDAQGFIIQNASEVTAQGLEATITARLSQDVTLNLNAAYLDSTFDDYAGASCTPDSEAPECLAGGDFFDASGYPTPLAADFTSNLQLVYENEMGIFVQGNVYYRSDINYGIGSPDRELGSTSILNLSTGYTMESGTRFSLFCKNCTDEKVPTSIAFDPGENNSGIASTQQTWGLDSVRSIGVTATYEF